MYKWIIQEEIRHLIEEHPDATECELNELYIRASREDPVLHEAILEYAFSETYTELSSGSRAKTAAAAR